jgi:carbon-monoxide dehydrogenase large subunit
MSEFGVGQSVRRTEDQRLVQGFGQYTDDEKRPGLLHAYMLRAPIAHARIKRIDAEPARTAPGVAAVYTGADIAEAKLGALGAAFPMANRDGTPMFSPRQPLLCTDRVRFAGDTLAMVVAETVDLAKDAAELIGIDYEELPIIVDTEAAADPNSPVIWEEAGSNVGLDWQFGDEAGTEAGLAKAAHITRLKLINNRIIVNPMEPRGIVSEFDPKTGRYTATLGSQGVHGVRRQLARALGVGADQVHVLTRDVGGGFGLKNKVYSEYPLTAFAARLLGRPVKWIGERGDAFLTDAHARDQVSEIAIGFDADFRILAIRVDTIAALGAYPSAFGPFIPTFGPAGMHAGVYQVPMLYNRVRCVFTNTTPTDAYRGAGRPEASYVIERVMDKAAREHGIAPDELRRRNFIPPTAMPYTTAQGTIFDSGDFPRNLADALKRSDWAGFPARRAVKAAEGKLAGIGLCYYAERTPGNMTEHGRITIDPSGLVRFYLGTQSTGQGHETAYAQLASEELGVPFGQIRILTGDSDELPEGGGSAGSRSTYMVRGVFDVAKAALIEIGKAKAATLLGGKLEAITFAEGRFSRPGASRSLGLLELAAEAGELDAAANYQHKAVTLPNGCHICELEIDPETGVFRILRYTGVDDVGRVLNPLLVRGQIQGGIVQGLGQAMGEAAIYDKESGQLLTGSFMDYWMPRADVLPEFDLTTNEIPCTTNPMGVKGCGEAGTVAAPSAFINAVVDALSPFGITHVDMPVTPLRLWEIIHQARNRSAA